MTWADRAITAGKKENIAHSQCKPNMPQQISSGEIQTYSQPTRSLMPSGHCSACSYCSHSTQRALLELAHKRWNWANSSSNGLQEDDSTASPISVLWGIAGLYPFLLDRFYGWFGRGCSHAVPVLAGTAWCWPGWSDLIPRPIYLWGQSHSSTHRDMARTHTGTAERLIKSLAPWAWPEPSW